MVDTHPPVNEPLGCTAEMGPPRAQMTVIDVLIEKHVENHLGYSRLKSIFKIKFLFTVNPTSVTVLIQYTGKR